MKKESWTARMCCASNAGRSKDSSQLGHACGKAESIVDTEVPEASEEDGDWKGRLQGAALPLREESKEAARVRLPGAAVTARSSIPRGPPRLLAAGLPDDAESTERARVRLPRRKSSPANRVALGAPRLSAAGLPEPPEAKEEVRERFSPAPCSTRGFETEDSKEKSVVPEQARARWAPAGRMSVDTGDWVYSYFVVSATRPASEDSGWSRFARCEGNWASNGLETRSRTASRKRTIREGVPMRGEPGRSEDEGEP